MFGGKSAIDLVRLIVTAELVQRARYMIQEGGGFRRECQPLFCFAKRTLKITADQSLIRCLQMGLGCLRQGLAAVVRLRIDFEAEQQLFRSQSSIRGLAAKPE